MEVQIRTTTAASKQVSTRKELADLLGASDDLICQITASPSEFYGEFTIPKSNGDPRTIRPPHRSLRRLQRSIMDALLARVSLRSCLHGGIKRHSIVSHARPHIGQKLVATLDIKRFFPSTSTSHLEPVLSHLGFCGEAICDLLQLVTLNNELPQGGPSSSLLANLAFSQGDSRFIALCRKRRLSYSRYVDDIAISGQCDFKDLKGPFCDAIRDAGYDIADSKLLFMPRHRRQIVTGLIVNDKLRPTDEFLKELRHDIQLCLDFGAQHVAISKGVTIRTLKNQLTGKVAHVRHVDGVAGLALRGRLCGVDWRRSVSVM
jgi:RNA-directed DNA polymerase